MIYLLLFIFLFIAELAYFRIADRFNIIDKPNERSSHTSVTLRGGGIVFYIAILLYFIIEGFQYPWFLTGLTLISFISFVDDIYPQSFKLRLVIQVTAMMLMFYQWGLFSYSWYFTIIALLICIGILNAYNFMDGINGITGGYTLVVAGSLLYINNFRIHFVDNDLIYCLILALVVFNFFNFRKKARCFAGDIGAMSTAFIVVFLLGLLIVKTQDFSYIILLSVYGVDTILTLIHRLIMKENIFLAHRKHAYQLLANELKIPHLVVSMFYALLQALVAFGFLIVGSYSYLYLVLVVLVLSTAYFLFMKKYYRLHKDSR
jgi:UDP-N-acetylmuramyl pentapeptide phosphotransferase/UDP-N-acetylglucosamine-1-phosphate transferase